MAGYPCVMVAALIKRIKAVNLRHIHHGRPERRREEEFGTAEVGRRNPDDGVGMLVDLHAAPYGGRIAVEMTVPAVIVQDDVGGAVLAVLVRGMEKPATISLHAERVEVIPAHHIGPDDRGIPATGIEPNSPDYGRRHQRHEAAVLFDQIPVIEI